MSTSVIDTAPSTAHEARIRGWTMNELQQGRGADPEQAVDLILRVAAGDADPLTGRHLSVHDDLDALLAHRDKVLAEDLYMLHPSRLEDLATD